MTRYELQDDIDDDLDEDDEDFDEDADGDDEEDDEDEDVETWQVSGTRPELKASLCLTSGHELPRLTPIFSSAEAGDGRSASRRFRTFRHAPTPAESS